MYIHENCTGTMDIKSMDFPFYMKRNTDMFDVCFVSSLFNALMNN